VPLFVLFQEHPLTAFGHKHEAADLVGLKVENLSGLLGSHFLLPFLEDLKVQIVTADQQQHHEIGKKTAPFHR